MAVIKWDFTELISLTWLLMLQWYILVRKDTYVQQWRQTLRACLHGDEGPQEGEVTRLGGVTRLSI